MQYEDNESSTDRGDPNKDYHQEDQVDDEEEEAKWVDAAEADRWEQEQAQRWSGDSVGTSPDP